MVDFVEGHFSNGGGRACGGILELHGMVFTLGEFLETALGIRLVFECRLFSPPIDGPELDHAAEERDDFFENADRFDGRSLV